MPPLESRLKRGTLVDQPDPDAYSHDCTSVHLSSLTGRESGTHDLNYCLMQLSPRLTSYLLVLGPQICSEWPQRCHWVSSYIR